MRGVRIEPYHNDVYNFHVDELECYAVGWNGVLVHNNSGLLSTTTETAASDGTIVSQISTADEAVVAGEAAAPSNGLTRFPEWQSGDPITKLTPEGNYPSWQTIRERYWQNRAASATPGEFGPSNIGAMNEGVAPSARVLVRDNATGQIQEIRVVKELHHARGGRGVPGHDTPVDLREVWPWEHAALDPSRRLSYTFIGFR